MGRVKDHFWEEICGEHAGCDDNGYEQELEMLAVDAAQARDRYLEALKKHQQGQNHDKSV